MPSKIRQSICSLRWFKLVQSGILGFKVAFRGSRNDVYRDERGPARNYPQLLAVSFFASFFWVPFWISFFPKVAIQDLPEGPQNTQKWLSKACPGESQSVLPIWTPFFHTFCLFPNLGMCCKYSKYYIQTTFFTYTLGPRKYEKYLPKTTSIRSKIHSQITPKPYAHRDPEKAAPKVFQLAKKCQ